MPSFKSTYNILKKQDECEVYNENWMDSDTLVLPPRIDWDYHREMNIEDVDIWEVLYEASEGIGVYAAWLPYAEFYMLLTGNNYSVEPRIINGFNYWDKNIETFYCQGAQEKLLERTRKLKIPLVINQIWVDDEDLWIYQKEKPSTKMIISGN